MRHARWGIARLDQDLTNFSEILPDLLRSPPDMGEILADMLRSPSYSAKIGRKSRRTWFTVREWGRRTAVFSVELVQSVLKQWKLPLDQPISVLLDTDPLLTTTLLRSSGFRFGLLWVLLKRFLYIYKLLAFTVWPWGWDFNMVTRPTMP